MHTDATVDAGRQIFTGSDVYPASADVGGAQNSRADTVIRIACIFIVGIQLDGVAQPCAGSQGHTESGAQVVDDEVVGKPAIILARRQGDAHRRRGLPIDGHFENITGGALVPGPIDRDDAQFVFTLGELVCADGQGEPTQVVDPGVGYGQFFASVDDAIAIDIVEHAQECGLVVAVAGIGRLSAAGDGEIAVAGAVGDAIAHDVGVDPAADGEVARSGDDGVNDQVGGGGG